jgi:hypothetical protein
MRASPRKVRLASVPRRLPLGFGTSVRRDPMVADSIVWAKLRALGEGAAIAGKRLWG